MTSSDRCAENLMLPVAGLSPITSNLLGEGNPVVTNIFGDPAWRINSVIVSTPADAHRDASGNAVPGVLLHLRPALHATYPAHFHRRPPGSLIRNTKAELGSPAIVSRFPIPQQVPYSDLRHLVHGAAHVFPVLLVLFVLTPYCHRPSEAGTGRRDRQAISSSQRHHASRHRFQAIAWLHPPGSRRSPGVGLSDGCSRLVPGRPAD